MMPDVGADAAVLPATITPIPDVSLPKGVNWMPVEGEQAAGIAKRSGLDGPARDKLLQSAAEILGSGTDPKDRQGTATGLVVGYVQSGKTLSFTTVMGLARDNGFPLVILIAGNKDSLLTQSHERLKRDLNVDGGEGLPAWRMERNPRAQDAHHDQLVRQAVANWRDPDLEEDERATVLLTVLKQNQRLRSLTELLREIDLKGVPVLVIDDEADQASLNAKVGKGEESTTYTRIRDLRGVLSCHTYLQYTATPQAPLLINIADTLSPDFVRVLDPGDGYVGGREFFAPNSFYVRDIPAADIPPDDELPADPPPSLLAALRVFFVGLAASLITSKARRSMLVHPSRHRVVHKESAQWITAAKTEWLALLQSSGDPDHEELVAEFKEAYDDLSATASTLPPFEEIIGKLPRALRNTTVIEFNTRGSPKTPEIKWRNADGWILVGGQAVDRGFTVDLLTVTYMPRGVGVGNADTLQQRARFFGYKRRYLGLCRIYLEQATRSAFEEYVEHEEIMRFELERIARTGESLRSWRRRFVLSDDLRPCRRNVISDSYVRARPGGGWTQQRGALMTPEARATNTAAFARLVKGLSFEEDKTYAATEASQKHVVAHDAPLQKIIDMLIDYRVEDPRDTAVITGVLVVLHEALRSNAASEAAVYRMRPEAMGVRRSVSEEGTLEDGFQQGRTNLADGGTAYPGDAFFRAADRLSVQLHSYDLYQDSDQAAEAAPLVAIHIPRELAKQWLVQVQAGQQ